ncbi:MAG TPA: 23S rRNA (uracil(1939)-C(5))-methyltransferase RlmD [Bacillota bacterium]|nr:23S rRNA (uracil(1939)-C(5))-methyltransferase RlmD [Bacillota bacterium]
MKKEIVIPVEKNQEIELHIDGLTHEGDGVGRYAGFTLFVPGALPGERVKAKVLKIKKSYGYAKLLEVLEVSPNRQEPPCPIYHRCGGCSLQHMSYEEQLRQKKIMVEENLRRIGKIEQVRILDTLGMQDPWRYRNKAQVPFGEEEGGLVGGFYAPRTHQIINMDACMIQHEKNDEIVNMVKEVAASLGIRAYNEETRRGLLRHVVAKVAFKTGELMLVLVVNGQEIPHQEEFIHQLTKRIPDIKSIVKNSNTKNTNVIFGDQTEIIWGEPYIYDYIGPVKFAISARSFYQVNPKQTEVLYGKALEYAKLTGNETVIDAYCGIGTISLFLAQKAKKVYGVEIVPDAIADAKRNAKLNHMDNVEFAVGEAEKVIPWWYAQGIRADVVVVDPPRKGCDETLLQTLLKMMPKRIVYVSCNPSTLARDLAILEQGGYCTEEVQPVDMFPHTSHVECCSLLVRKN